ncbi:AraC family transcriptional regulator [Aquimarina spongiae]|uniref:Transcriptional regulator, AraC family n=1 Tax=Aquimarina spongiae TaxID=570521 RepID=A0A1M6GIL8_9FLAO|nr:AraC family transcriptional regulator [Aquimarina spongiae]SHJ09807.1 transcriptional regulator, AraC family [Aquimarina spongiae]
MKNRTNINEYHRLPILDGLELLNVNSCTFDFPFHAHDTFNISLILKNTFNTKLTDRNLQAPVGTICITNPKEIHATPCDNLIGNSFFTFYVSSDVIRKLNQNQNVSFKDKIIYDQNIFNELYFLSLNFNDNNIHFENILKSTLKKLISKYSTVKEISYNTNKFFQNFLDSTSFDTFSLSKTASQFGMSKYKFIRLFKQETGLTPNNFILLKKIEQSKAMLKNGNSIFDVAIDCGFYDNSHFYKNFKRFIGVNPLEFQNAFYAI